MNIHMIGPCLVIRQSFQRVKRKYLTYLIKVGTNVAHNSIKKISKSIMSFVENPNLRMSIQTEHFFGIL